MVKWYVFKIYFIICVCACMCTCIWEGHRSAWSQSYWQLWAPWCGCWDPNSSLTEEQQMLLTTEPPLQPILSFSIWSFHRCMLPGNIWFYDFIFYTDCIMCVSFVWHVCKVCPCCCVTCGFPFVYVNQQFSTLWGGTGCISDILHIRYLHYDS